MRKPERSSYTPLDFLQWHEAGTLIISPKFQRRGVWSRAAQSYLIDTLLLGFPVPPIYIRITQSAEKKAVIREIVDGQQRMNAVISYMLDKYSLSKNIESKCVGKRFSQLTEDEQARISEFSFICEVFYGVDDRDILQIFARLNTHSVKLNSQELRNGKFFGEFKQSSYQIAFEHLEFWRNNRIFSEQAIARMQEVELTSELLILMLDGLQDKKKSIDGFYKRLDDEFARRLRIEDCFRAVVDAINEAMGEDLPQTEFRRVPLFYSLFAAVCHRMFGVPGLNLPTNGTGRLTRRDREGLQEAVRQLSNTFGAALDEDGHVDAGFEAFVTACLRQTDNFRPRHIRTETIYRAAFS